MLRYMYTSSTVHIFITECIEALSSPTTANTLLPDNGISPSSGSHHPTALHQTLGDKSVIGSANTASMPLASQPHQGLSCNIQCIVPEGASI